MKKILKKITTILGTVLLIFLIAVVIVMFDARMSGESPNVFGFHIFRVSSGSMEPELMIGDVILVKDVDPSKIEKGDTVTYMGDEGDFDDKFITHKVIENPEYINGEYIFTTQGVSEYSLEPDPKWDERQLIGVVVCKVPFLNALYSFFLKPYGLMTFILLIVVLFGYEIISLIISYKKSEDDDYEDPENSLEENKSSEIEESSQENEK